MSTCSCIVVGARVCVVRVTLRAVDSQSFHPPPLPCVCQGQFHGKCNDDGLLAAVNAGQGPHWAAQMPCHAMPCCGDWVHCSRPVSAADHPMHTHATHLLQNYQADECVVRFTDGQVARMHSMIITYRPGYLLGEAPRAPSTPGQPTAKQVLADSIQFQCTASATAGVPTEQ